MLNMLSVIVNKKHGSCLAIINDMTCYYSHNTDFYKFFARMCFFWFFLLLYNFILNIIMFDYVVDC